MVSITPLTTEAERALSERFEKRSEAFTGTSLEASRSAAFLKFAAAGLPHRRVEAYKYTDLKARLRQLPPAAPKVDLPTVDALLAQHPALAPSSSRVVFANGRFIEERSSVPAGVTLTSMLAPHAILTDVGALVADSDDAITLANLSLFEGGAILTVEGEVNEPVEIVHLSTADVMAMGRVSITVAPGASFSVLERTIAEGASVTNNLSELAIGAEASLSLIRVLEGRSAAATDLSTHHVKIAERAQLDHLTVSSGTGMMRGQVFCHVAGDEATANFRTATVAIGDRHSDSTLVVRHNAVGSTSSEVFRSAVGKNGKAVVQGQIVVDPHAQKTDAKMMSNALFLDDTGEVVNKPELEIFADDVQCGHGATSGDLDEDNVFYLRARGIPAPMARRLLVEAFLLEALADVADEALNETLADILRRGLDGMDADEADTETV